MNDLKPIIFLFPVVALVLVTVLYISLLKKSINNKAFNRFFFIMTAAAFLLNFSWELLQMPLYDNTSFKINHVVFCTLGSVADAIMVLLIYLGLAVMFKNAFWIYPLKWQRILLLILTGGIGATLSEIRHLSIGNWAYSDLMPLLPYVRVGISPVLQFMILPLLTYIFSFKLSSLITPSVFLKEFSIKNE